MASEQQFNPLPDLPPEQQVLALLEVIHNLSRTAFEARLENGELAEQNAELRREVEYLRGVVGEQAVNNYKSITNN